MKIVTFPCDMMSDWGRDVSMIGTIMNPRTIVDLVTAKIAQQVFDRPGLT